MYKQCVFCFYFIYLSLTGKVESSKAFDTHGNFRADEDMLNYVKGLPNGYAANSNNLHSFTYGTC